MLPPSISPSLAVNYDKFLLQGKKILRNLQENRNYLKKVLAILKTFRYNGSAWDFPMTIFYTTHPGTGRSCVRTDGRLG